MIQTMEYSSPLGPLVLAEKDGALAGLWFQGQKYFLGPYRAKEAVSAASPLLCQAAGWLDRYFAGEAPPRDRIPLSPAGTPFQKEAWLLLCEIPYGEVTTYGVLARELARRRGLARMSAQAVGGAVGHNPISIFIPCHRVVGTDGALTGYAGGLEKKEALLSLERGNPLRAL